LGTLVFALSGQTEASDECEAAPSGDRSGHSSRIHLSAIIAFACYVVGVALCVLASPTTLADLLDGGTGRYVQLLALAAFIIVVAAIQRHMGISLRASQTKTPGELCTTGPFNYTRNPIYLAFIVPLAALGYFSLWAAAISIGLYVLAITRFVLLNEERVLRSKFGTAFEIYCSRTPRWIFF
jgi:protein-S-isoprenylcysteine O-methyltransferase Ste14